MSGSNQNPLPIQSPRKRGRKNNAGRPAKPNPFPRPETRAALQNAGFSPELIEWFGDLKKSINDNYLLDRQRINAQKNPAATASALKAESYSLARADTATDYHAPAIRKLGVWLDDLRNVGMPPRLSPIHERERLEANDATTATANPLLIVYAIAPTGPQISVFHTTSAGVITAFDKDLKTERSISEVASTISECYKVIRLQATAREDGGGYGRFSSFLTATDIDGVNGVVAAQSEQLLRSHFRLEGAVSKDKALYATVPVLALAGTHEVPVLSENSALSSVGVIRHTSKRSVFTTAQTEEVIGLDIPLNYRGRVRVVFDSFFNDATMANALHLIASYLPAGGGAATTALITPISTSENSAATSFGSATVNLVLDLGKFEDHVGADIDGAVTRLGIIVPAATADSDFDEAHFSVEMLDYVPGLTNLSYCIRVSGQDAATVYDVHSDAMVGFVRTKDKFPPVGATEGRWMSLNDQRDAQYEMLAAGQVHQAEAFSFGGIAKGIFNHVVKPALKELL